MALEAKPNKRAVVVGATSAVGHHIVEALGRDASWNQVVLVVRKETSDFAGIVGSTKIVQRVLPSLDALDTLKGEFEGFDAMFCSLGAYMKKDGAEMAKRVDFGYVTACADLAEKCGIETFAMLSAPEADASISEDATGWQLYKRLKGLAEEAVLQKNIKFLYIFQPGILFGRFSAQSTGSVRSKGNWDSFVKCFGCCCCCLVAKAGVQCDHLGAVIVSVASTGGGLVGAGGGKVTLNNAMIVQYALSAE